MTFQLVLAVVLLLVVAGAGVAVMASLRKKREAKDTAAFHASRERELHIPVSLHPVIDPDICIGSLACIRACPEGDILGIVEGTARLIEGAKCIGHGRCAEECPVDAIKLVFGSGERGVDLPSLAAGFETSRPGVHIVGELGGMGLIKNAIAQGVQVVDHLAKTVANPGNGATDVAIVGAGPAGLAAAAACRTHGLSFRLLEQHTLGGAVAHYPRQKLVMTESVEVPGYGRIGKKTLRKEEILETFQDLATTTGVTVEEGVKVESLEGDLDRFVLHTTQGTVQARRVVLAVGRRGTPRKLGVPGEELDKVTYGLIDPDQYEGKRVMVIGGGDSAIEAAVMLAEDTGAEVSISYRGPAFARCRPANREAIERMVDAGRIHAFMSSNVRAIEDDAVLIDVGGRQAWLANEYVIVNIGGELPFAFLENVGVEVKRHHGEDRGFKPGVDFDQEEKASRRLNLSLFGVGAAIIAFLAIVGWSYYLIPVDLRPNSPLDAALKPSGWWGHGVGIVATGFMMLNFLYAGRKRLKFLNRGKLRNWLSFHMFVGFMAPLVIVFHAAFQSRNLLATVTAVSLGIVVATGIIGRFLFGLVPTSKGKAVELATLRSRWERHRSRITNLMAASASRLEARKLLAWATTELPDDVTLTRHLLEMPGELTRAWKGLNAARPLFGEAEHFKDFRNGYLRLLLMRTQVGFYKSLKRLMGVWRILHVALAVLMVFVIAAHIGVSLYIGYTWIFH